MRAGYMAEDATDLHDDVNDRPDDYGLFNHDIADPQTCADPTASRFYPGNPNLWGAA